MAVVVVVYGVVVVAACGREEFDGRAGVRGDKHDVFRRRRAKRAKGNLWWRRAGGKRNNNFPDGRFTFHYST